MSRRNAPSINWHSLFQKIDSDKSRLTIISGLLLIGFGFGNFTYKLMSDRDLLKQERELNDCHDNKRESNKELINQVKFLEFEINKLKYDNRVLKDSIRSYGKKK